MHIITLGNTTKEEVALLKSLIAWSGVYVHVRKPDLSEAQYAQYLAAFSWDERQSLIAHQHPALSIDLGLPRLHLSATRRTNLSAQEQRLYASSSTHSWDEFNGLPSSFEMAFISPVFPSISKKGYGIEQQISPAGRKNWTSKAIALGGINAARIAHMGQHDFDDFALCGAFWEAADPLLEAKLCYQLHQQWTNNHLTF